MSDRKREPELWRHVRGGNEGYEWLVWDPNVGNPGDVCWYETLGQAEMRLAELTDQYRLASSSAAVTGEDPS